MLNMDEKPDIVVMGGVDDEIDDIDVAAKTTQISAKGKPSLFETLERNAEKSRAMFDGTVEKAKPVEVSI